MKVLSIRGNKVSFDFTQDEYDMLLRDGLQIYIEKEIGKNKVNVTPFSDSVKEADQTYEIPTVMANECLRLSVNQALENMLNRLEKEDKIKNMKKRNKFTI